jgi:hypothetical protein
LKEILMNAFEIDGRIRSLGAALAKMTAEAGRLLLELKRTRGYIELQFSCIVDYASARLGYSAQKTKEVIELSERAEGLPRIREALERGTADWTKLRTIARVATSEDEAVWLGKCSTMTNRELEIAASLLSGVLPRIRTTEQWTDEQYGIIEAVVRDVRRECPGASREEALIIALTRGGTGGAPARPPIQLVIYKCEACGKTEHQTRLGVAPVEPATAARAACDAEIITAEKPERVASQVPPTTRRMVLARDRHRCVVPGCSGRDYVEVHHIVERENGGGHEPENLVTLCTRHHSAVHEGKLDLLDVLEDLGWPNLGESRAAARSRRPREPAPA